MKNKEPTSKQILNESLLTTVILLVVLGALSFIPFIGKYSTTVTSVLLIYIPIMMSDLRGHKYVLDGDSWIKGVKHFIIWSLVIFPLFFLLGHFWMKIVYSLDRFRFASFPDYKFILIQILAVAFPEELYFRGYLQTSLNGFFKPRWNVFGVKLGWSWILTAMIFAFAHSVITIQWWHFAIFFPALLFGYLREKTGGIIASTLFHALSNILMRWFVSCY